MIVKLCIATLALTGCAARTGFGISGTTALPSAGSPPPSARTASMTATSGERGPDEDAHWFQSDDYLVSTKRYDNQKLKVTVGKLVTPATSDTRGEAQFLLANGTTEWVRTYHRSRPATNADLRVGTIAFCHADWFDRSSDGPRSKRASRTKSWIMAPITDVGDLYKGRVTVASTSCAVDALRIPLH